MVFSIIEGDVVRPKFAQCNNCGIIHRVTDVCRSEIKQGREDMRSIVTIDDIKPSLPPRLVDLLQVADVDLPTWEAAQHAYEQKQWGTFVVLSTDVDGGVRHGKYLQILGDNMFKVDSFEREEEVVR